MSLLLTPHELLGRRVEFTHPGFPDFTVISYERSTDDCYVHRSDGVKQHLRLSMVLECVRRGALRESARAPFVWGRHEGRSL